MTCLDGVPVERRNAAVLATCDADWVGSGPIFAQFED